MAKWNEQERKPPKLAATTSASKRDGQIDHNVYLGFGNADPTGPNIFSEPDQLRAVAQGIQAALDDHDDRLQLVPRLDTRDYIGQVVRNCVRQSGTLAVDDFLQAVEVTQPVAPEHQWLLRPNQPLLLVTSTKLQAGRGFATRASGALAVGILSIPYASETYKSEKYTEAIKHDAELAYRALLQVRSRGGGRV